MMKTCIMAKVMVMMLTMMLERMAMRRKQRMMCVTALFRAFDPPASDLLQLCWHVLLRAHYINPTG